MSSTVLDDLEARSARQARRRTQQETKLLSRAVAAGARGVILWTGLAVVGAVTVAMIGASAPLVAIAQGVVLTTISGAAALHRSRTRRALEGPARSLIEAPHRITRVRLLGNGAEVFVGERRTRLFVARGSMPMLDDILRKRCIHASFGEASAPASLPPARIERGGKE